MWEREISLKVKGPDRSSNAELTVKASSSSTLSPTDRTVSSGVVMTGHVLDDEQAAGLMR